jgi:hypothetical protein
MNQNCNLTKVKHGKQTIVSCKHQNVSLSFLLHFRDDISNSLFLHIFISVYILMHILGGSKSQNCKTWGVKTAFKPSIFSDVLLF